jgi:hypothetical protein
MQEAWCEESGSSTFRLEGRNAMMMKTRQIGQVMRLVLGNRAPLLLRAVIAKPELGSGPVRRVSRVHIGGANSARRLDSRGDRPRRGLGGRKPYRYLAVWG